MKRAGQIALISLLAGINMTASAQPVPTPPSKKVSGELLHIAAREVLSASDLEKIIIDGRTFLLPPAMTDYNSHFSSLARSTSETLRANDNAAASRQAWGKATQWTIQQIGTNPKLKKVTQGYSDWTAGIINDAVDYFWMSPQRNQATRAAQAIVYNGLQRIDSNAQTAIGNIRNSGNNKSWQREELRLLFSGKRAASIVFLPRNT